MVHRLNTTDNTFLHVVLNLAWLDSNIIQVVLSPRPDLGKSPGHDGLCNEAGLSPRVNLVSVYRYIRYRRQATPHISVQTAELILPPPLGLTMNENI